MKYFARAVLVATLLGLPLPVQAAIYGLVIGVDDYLYVPSLSGAVNDARDIARALRGRDAEVTLLLDSDATRARIEQSFEAILAKVEAGDTIVITYAGHGVQLPEALAGDEPDGKDETFILHGFNVTGPGLAERIRDNDIAAMLARVPRDVAVLMVADSCHSGTMTRSVDPRGDLGPMRYVELGPLTEADPLAKPAPETRAIELKDFPNVVYAHAARDDQQTPEVEIDGQYRGALSWSVARALGGQAAGEDGQTSLDDFQGFVIEQVRALSGTRQTPGVTYSRAIEITSALGQSKGLGAIFGNRAQEGAATPAAQPPAPDMALAEAPSLFVRGDAPAGGLRLAGLETVETEETARLLWDRARGELVDRATADVIAEVRGQADLDRAVLKWRAVQPLLRWTPQRALAFRLEPDDRRFRLGEEIHITIAPPEPAFSYLTIVNLASTGEVQFIYPSPGHTQVDADRLAPGEAEKRLGPSPVSAPTGADHVIALASRARLDALHAALDRLHGQPAPEELLALLATHGGNSEAVRVGLLPIFTER